MTATATPAAPAQTLTKAEKEKQRRAIVKAITAAKLETTPGKLEDDQKARALAVGLEEDGAPVGLTGKALANFILKGERITEQVQKGEEAKALAKADERTRTNVTRSQDPEAAELAVAAKALAPEVKSAFLPKDARCFLDDILKGQKVADLMTRQVEVEVGEGDEKKTETQDVKITFKQLEAFGVGGEKDKDVRAHLAALGSGTRLWGRKLALMILAQKKREK